jgi:PAS domain S-box-containing protein
MEHTLEESDSRTEPLLEKIRRLRGKVESMHKRIQEHDRCEASMLETNACLGAYLHSARELVCFLDGENRILSASRMFLALYRLQEESVEGKTFLELARLSEFHKTAFIRGVRWEQEAWESRGSVTCEDIVQTAEGEDRLFEVTRTPLFYENGERKGMVLVGVDVTERVKREFESQRLMAEQSAIFENALVGILYLRDDAIVRVNHAMETMFGFNRNELSGLCADALFGEDAYARLKERARDALERGESYAMETRLSRRDGRAFYARITGKAIESGPKPRAEIWLVDDIDEEMRIQRLREETERIMRHDLKAPLQGVLGAADLLLERPLDKTCRSLVDIILASGGQIQETIDNSLDLFQIEEGLRQLRPQKLDLIPLLRKVTRGFEAAMHKKHLGFSLTLEEKPAEGCFVLGEARLLENLFGNLIKNAVEASPERGGISVNICAEAQTAEVNIHNAGAIPEDIRDRFGERYATSGKPAGAGLGVYSARLIATAHGGSLDFTTSKQEGTTLVVTLPRG